MALATFYHPTLEPTDTLIELSATESAHAIKSRRLSSGSRIQLINGQGLLAQASIRAATKRAVSVNIESVEKTDRPYSLSIATAIPKGDRQRTMVDMLSQLGVTKIVPLRCERSITQFKPAMQEKWQRYAIEACKQSQNLWLPTIAAEQTLEQLLARKSLSAIYADSQGQSIQSLKKKLKGDLTVLIGPEGGFSQAELTMLDACCIPINLGSNILRTELASVVVTSQIRMQNA